MRYALLLVWGIATVLNVAVNPVVFYWRMKPFRKFPNKRVEESGLIELATQLQFLSNNSLQSDRKQRK